MAYYIFNALRGDPARLLRAGLWAIDDGELHRDALAVGDLVLVYHGAPARAFVGRAELASAAHDWTPPEAEAYPGESPGGVLLAKIEEWDPPVPMSSVLSRLDPVGDARADFDAGVVLISAREYATALAVAAGSG